MELVDAHGGVALHEMLTVATSWAVLDDPVQPLAKLKLDVVGPVKGSARIVLAAANYAGMWRHIVGGGLAASRHTSGCRRQPPCRGYVRRRHAGLHAGGHRLISRYRAPDAYAWLAALNQSRPEACEGALPGIQLKDASREQLAEALVPAPGISALPHRRRLPPVSHHQRPHWLGHLRLEQPPDLDRPAGSDGRPFPVELPADSYSHYLQCRCDRLSLVTRSRSGGAQCADLG